MKFWQDFIIYLFVCTVIFAILVGILDLIPSWLNYILIVVFLVIPFLIVRVIYYGLKYIYLKARERILNREKS